MPGGPGTLTEVTLMWNLMIVHARRPVPRILVGDGWRKVIDEFLRSFQEYTPESQRGFILFASDARSAVAML